MIERTLAVTVYVEDDEHLQRIIRACHDTDIAVTIETEQPWHSVEVNGATVRQIP